MLQKCFNYFALFINISKLIFYLREIATSSYFVFGGQMKIKEIIVVEGKDDTTAIQQSCSCRYN